MYGLHQNSDSADTLLGECAKSYYFRGTMHRYKLLGLKRFFRIK